MLLLICLLSTLFPATSSSASASSRASALDLPGSSRSVSDTATADVTAGLGAVATLDESNFDTLLRSTPEGKTWLVEFYAPW